MASSAKAAPASRPSPRPFSASFRRSVRITGGRIDFEGTDLLRLSSRGLRAVLGRDIALIPQDPLTALNPARRIDAQMTDGLRLKRGLSAKGARALRSNCSTRCKFASPNACSQAIRTSFPAACANACSSPPPSALEPKLVIADEPTTALDVTVQKQILRLIRALQERARHQRALRLARPRRRGENLRPRHRALHGQGGGAGRHRRSADHAASRLYQGPAGGQPALRSARYRASNRRRRR